MEHRRIIIPESGSPDVLQVIEERIPEPEANEVRVKVFAAGVARADILMRRGQYPEAVPSYPYTMALLAFIMSKTPQELKGYLRWFNILITGFLLDRFYISMSADSCRQDIRGLKPKNTLEVKNEGR